MIETRGFYCFLEKKKVMKNKLIASRESGLLIKDHFKGISIKQLSIFLDELPLYNMYMHPFIAFDNLQLI
jgi:hypothetical protein